MSEIPDAAIEAAARAIFEDGTGDYSWAEMVTEDPSRADLWREDARRTLAAALPHLTPAPQAEGGVREALGGVIANAIDHVVSWDSPDCPNCGTAPCYHPEEAGCAECADAGWPCNYALAIADAVLSSGLVVPAAIHKVATDALEAGDACGAVGCRALVERDAALAAVERVRSLAKEMERNAALVDEPTPASFAATRIRAALDTTPRA